MRQKHRLQSYLVGLLLATELMLLFSSLGYITVGTFTLSFVPIIIYAMGYMFGPRYGMLAGLVFGLASMWLSDVGMGASFDTLYSPTRSGNPWASLLLAVGTRLLLGLLAGMGLQRARKQRKKRYFQLAAVTSAVQTIYTAVSLLVGFLCFPQVELRAINIGPNGMELLWNLAIECAVSSAAVIGLCALIRSERMQQALTHCQAGLEKVPPKWILMSILGMAMFTLAFSASMTGRFLWMGSRVFGELGQPLAHQTVSRLVQLELQRQLSCMAFSMMVILLVLIVSFYIIDRKDNLVYQAARDQMTGLYNRETAREKIRQRMAERSGRPCAFLMIDIDGLKTINDTLGHTAGDEAIQGMAAALRAKFRETDILARIGGDEFAVFLQGVASEAELHPILERLLRQIKQTPIAEGTQYLQASIGVRLDETGSLDLDEMYRHADEALYQAKNDGRNRYAFYQPSAVQQTTGVK